MRIVVVGGGMQGRVIANNLRNREERPDVVIADLREPGGLVTAGVEYVKANVLDPADAREVAKNADAVVLAVPSEIAHDALANLILAGAAVADVSFTPDPPLALDAAAKASGSCCIVDCGVAPGLSHILVGAAHSELGSLDSVRIWVGGMPQIPPPVFRHAVYFNPCDLLAQYVRPARARRAKNDIAPAPLDVPVEQYVDSDLGKLEAFLSDGLRSLITSYPLVGDMAELTLRWPGHLDAMKTLRELGLLSDARSLEAVAATLSARYGADDHPDVLVMVVEAKRGNDMRSWRLIDRRTDGQSAVSRTTGFTTAAVAMLLARKQFTEAGVHPPERLGHEANLANAVIKDLSERGINVLDIVAVV